MNRRQFGIALGAVACGPLLGACAGDPPPPPPPTVVGIELGATPDVNPDGTGIAKPLRVRVLRLASTQAMAQADFFALDADPAAALGKELVGFDDFVLGPGATTTYEREVEPEARQIAVMGAYFLIDRTQWRAWAPVQRNITNLFEARFGPDGVTLTEVGA
jgi:type VI secretion system protein VasD